VSLGLLGVLYIGRYGMHRPVILGTLPEFQTVQAEDDAEYKTVYLSESSFPTDNRQDP